MIHCPQHPMFDWAKVATAATAEEAMALFSSFSGRCPGWDFDTPDSHGLAGGWSAADVGRGACRRRTLGGMMARIVPIKARGRRARFVVCAAQVGQVWKDNPLSGWSESDPCIAKHPEAAFQSIVDAALAARLADLEAGAIAKACKRAGKAQPTQGRAARL